MRRIDIHTWIDPHQLTTADFYDKNSIKEPDQQQSEIKEKHKTEPTHETLSENKSYAVQNYVQPSKETDNRNFNSTQHNGFDLSKLLSSMDFDNPLFKMAINMFLGDNAGAMLDGLTKNEVGNGKGGFDLVKILPILMNSGILNSGLFSPKDNHSRSARVIDLGEYEVTDAFNSKGLY